MKIEAITICVGDLARKFLALTLFQNYKFFDRYFVITDSKDIKTLDFCSNYNISVFITDTFYSKGAIFNKGAVYNECFEILNYKDEVCILDCDIFIPNNLGKLLINKDFDPEYIYGCRRIILPKYNDFIQIVNGDETKKESFWCPEGIGYGYHQMFNLNCSTTKKYGALYPESYEAHAANGDWQFRNRWGETINGDKGRTGLLRDITEHVWHLGDPNMSGGENFFK